jgi:serine protease Do
MSHFKSTAPWILGTLGAVGLAVTAVGWAQKVPAPAGFERVPVDAQVLASAQSLSQAFRAAAKNSLPAVVSIETRGKPVAMRGGDRGGNPGEMFRGTPFEELFKQDPRFRELFQNPQGDRSPRPMGSGTGFIVDAAGVILTANHVVADADRVLVRLADGREYVATDVRTDPKTDVAILRIAADGPLPTLPLGDSDVVEVGDWVLAIGSPFGLDATVTAGIISAKGRGPNITEREDFLQTDAAINPGNSGGPLVNLQGEVVGINTAISTRGGGNDGVAFTVPINLARWVSDQLVDKGRVTRAYLGVSVQAIDDKLARQLTVPVGRGALVSGVMPNSPAAESGLETGDLVLKFNGKEIRGIRDLQGVVERCDVDGRYPLDIIRDGKEQTLMIKMKEMPQNFSLRQLPGQGDEEQESTPPDEKKPAPGSLKELGLELDRLTPDVARQLGFKGEAAGVVVTGVEPDGAAFQAGLREGMLIEKVGTKRVTSVAEFTDAVRDVDWAQGVLLLVKSPRGGGSFVVLKK